MASSARPEETTLKIIAFAASNSRQSINKKLVTHAAELLAARSAGAALEVLDLNDYQAALYGIDREQQHGIPEAVHRFRQKIGEADVLLISLAEHNGTYTAAWKSLFDWCSRVDRDIFRGKPAVLLSTSPGKRGGASVLEQATNAFPRFRVAVKASLAVPSFHASFDSERGELADPELRAQLEAALDALDL